MKSRTPNNRNSIKKIKITHTISPENKRRRATNSSQKVRVSSSVKNLLKGQTQKLQSSRLISPTMSRPSLPKMVSPGKRGAPFVADIETKLCDDAYIAQRLGRQYTPKRDNRQTRRDQPTSRQSVQKILTSQRSNALILNKLDLESVSSPLRSPRSQRSPKSTNRGSVSRLLKNSGITPSPKRNRQQYTEMFDFDGSQTTRAVLRKMKTGFKSSLKKVVTKVIARSRTGSVGPKMKDNNQDAYRIVYDFAGTNNQTLLIVCDGHGTFGHQVSDYLTQILPMHIENHMPLALKLNPKMPVPIDDISMIRAAINDGILAANYDVKMKLTEFLQFSGTTLNLVLIRGDILISANVGDSRGVLAQKNAQHAWWQTVQLSFDHKPENLEERMRIEASGGEVDAYKDQFGQPLGPYRVWIAQSIPRIPGLAMSRSIGDTEASSVGVIPSPEILDFRLTQNDKFLILASDGVWEFISSEKAISICSQYWGSGNVEIAADQLMRRSLERWQKEDDSIDDITVIVAFINVTNNS